LRHILPYERCGIAEFGCKLAALRLEHITNDNPRSFCGEQASLGGALSACAPTDEYDFAFEAIQFLLLLLEGMLVLFGMRITRCLPRPTLSAARRAGHRLRVDSYGVPWRAVGKIQVASLNFPHWVHCNTDRPVNVGDRRTLLV
jgi:hypothetical protein